MSPPAAFLPTPAVAPVTAATAATAGHDQHHRRTKCSLHLPSPSFEFHSPFFTPRPPMSNLQTPPVAIRLVPAPPGPPIEAARCPRSRAKVRPAPRPARPARRPSRRPPRPRPGARTGRLPRVCLRGVAPHGAQVAADDDRLGVHVVAEVGEYAPDGASGFADDAPRAEVAAADELDSPATSRSGPWAPRAAASRPGTAATVSQAAAAAADARDAVGLHLHMAELAGDAGRAAVHAPPMMRPAPMPVEIFT